MTQIQEWDEAHRALLRNPFRLWWEGDDLMLGSPVIRFSSVTMQHEVGQYTICAGQLWPAHNFKYGDFGGRWLTGKISWHFVLPIGKYQHCKGECYGWLQARSELLEAFWEYYQSAAKQPTKMAQHQLLGG